MKKEMLIICAVLAALSGRVFATDSQSPARALEAVTGASDDAEAAEALASVCPDPLRAAALLRESTPGPGLAGDAACVTIEAPDGRSTKLHVHLPADYDGTRAFPCMLLLHGHGSNGREMLEMSRRILDRISCVGVAPDAKRYRGMLPMIEHWWKHTEDGFPLQALKWARSRLSIDHERIHVLGYSMGGFGAWNLSLRFPDQFACAVPLAGGISQTEFVGATDARTRSLMRNAGMLELMFAHGDADRVVPVHFDRESHAELERLGVPHRYREIKGGSHILSEVVAASRGEFRDAGFMTEFVDLMGAASRRPLADPVDLTAFDAPAQARFVRVDEAESAPFRIRASINGNCVVVDTEGVKAFTVLVDGDALPADREIVVTVNGRAAFCGIPKPGLDSVVRSFRSRFDRGRIFPSEIRIEVPKPEEQGF